MYNLRPNSSDQTGADGREDGRGGSYPTVRHMAGLGSGREVDRYDFRLFSKKYGVHEKR